MASQLSSDQLAQLTPLLGSVARLIARDSAASTQQLDLLLGASDQLDNSVALAELQRWARLLQNVAVNPEEKVRHAVVEGLLLRGLPEAAVLLAVDTVAGRTSAPPPTPTPPSIAAPLTQVETALAPPLPVSQPLSVQPERLEWTLSPGQAVTGILTVQGGPGRVVMDSDQVQVTPLQFGPELTRLSIAVRPMSEGTVWTMLKLVTASTTREVPVFAQWSAPAYSQINETITDPLPPLSAAAVPTPKVTPVPAPHPTVAAYIVPPPLVPTAALPTAVVPLGPAQPVDLPRPRGNMVRNALLAVGLLAILGLGVGGYLVFQALDRSNIPVARLLPPNAYGYLSLAPPKGTQKAALDRLQQAFKDQPKFSIAWDHLTQQISTWRRSTTTRSEDCGITLDLQPTGTPDLDTVFSYLGENVTVAMLPASEDELARLNRGQEDGEALLLSKLLFFADLDFNPLDKKGPLPQIKQQTDKPTDLVLAENYRGIDIRKLTLDQCSILRDHDIFVVLLRGTAALAFDESSLRGVIDRYKDGGSLQDSPVFQSLEADLPKDRLATLYLNLSSLYGTWQSVGYLNGSGNESYPLTVKGALSIVLAAHDEGLQLDSAINGQIGNVALGTDTSFQTDVLDDVPEQSWGFYAGANLKALIAQGLELARRDHYMRDQLDGNLASWRDQTGIDFEREVLPLLAGDYVVSGKGARGYYGTDLTWVAELRESGAGSDLRRLLERLNAYYENQTPIQSVSMGRGTFWSIGEYSPYAYGVDQDKFFAFGKSGYNSTIEDVSKWAGFVLQNQGHGLGSNSTVQARLGKLPKGSNSQLYLDLARIRIEGWEASLSSNDAYYEYTAPFVYPIQYLVAGNKVSTENNTTHAHIVLFLGISK